MASSKKASYAVPLVARRPVASHNRSLTSSTRCPRDCCIRRSRPCGSRWRELRIRQGLHDGCSFHSCIHLFQCRLNICFPASIAQREVRRRSHSTVHRREICSTGSVSLARRLILQVCTRAAEGRKVVQACTRAICTSCTCACASHRFVPGRAIRGWRGEALIAKRRTILECRCLGSIRCASIVWR